MKTAVHGTPAKTGVGRAISDEQQRLLLFIEANPGCTNTSIFNNVNYYKTPKNVELAVQGLIKRGLVRWKLDAGTFNYFITKQGTEKLSSSKG